jgi:hypothetical protein
MWISRHCRILENEEADNLAKKGTNKLPVDQTAVIPFVVGKEVGRSHLRQEYLNRWKANNGYNHLPCRAEEFQAMSRMKINPLNVKLNPICHLLALLEAHHILHVSRIRVKVAVVLLTGFTTPTAHISHNGRIADFVGTRKKVISLLCAIVCHCVPLSITGMQMIQNLGLYNVETQGSRKHEGEQTYKPSGNRRLGIDP